MISDLSEIKEITINYSNAADAIIHACTTLQVEMSRRGFYIPRGTERYFNFKRDMPYVIEKTNTPGTQILLNCRFRPLGSYEKGEEWFDFEEFKHLHIHLTSDQIASITEPDGRILFLKDVPPWFNGGVQYLYAQRLVKLYQYVRPESYELFPY